MDQRLCFRYIDSAVPLLSKSEINFKPLAIFCSCTAWFVSVQIGNPESRFSHNEAHLATVRGLVLVPMARRVAFWSQENKEVTLCLRVLFIYTTQVLLSLLQKCYCCYAAQFSPSCSAHCFLNIDTSHSHLLT